MCPIRARVRQLPSGGAGAQRRAGAGGIAGFGSGGTQALVPPERHVEILETASPLAQKRIAHQSQTHPTPLSGIGPESAPPLKKSGCLPTSSNPWRCPLRPTSVGHSTSRVQPGKPTQNAYTERFNSSFRRELLDAHLFRSLAHVRQLVDEWMYDYNIQRPHQAMNFMTPLEFKQVA